MPNYSGSVTCAEEAGTISENYDDVRGIMKASVALRCAWDSRHALVQDIVGGRRSWPHATGGPVPTAATATIVPAQINTPESGAYVDGQAMKYRDAIVTINYSTEAVDLVSEALEPTAEFVTLDYRRFRWGAGAGPLLTEEEAPGLLVRGLNFVRTELQVPVSSMNPGTLLGLIGRVNNAPLSGTVLTLPFSEETLLYAPPTINVTTNSLGQQTAQVVKKFTFKPEGWNKFFRGATNSWEYIHVAGSGTPYKSYVPADLSPLLA